RAWQRKCFGERAALVQTVFEYERKVMPKTQVEERSRVRQILSECAAGLRREFPAWISTDPKGFRNVVLGTMRGLLHRERAGRKSNPAVIHANRLYEQQRSAGRQGDWDAIARAVIPGFEAASPNIRRSRRFKLRAQVHSYRHSLLQRQRLIEIR